MKIATLNIDWARKYKSKTHIHKIEKELNSLDFDIIIVTEGVDLLLPAYDFIYKTNQLPQNIEYEGVNYTDYLKNTPAYRIIIYSKVPYIKSYEVSDKFTSVCKQFETDIGLITIYATIIGTWFKKEPYASKELNNCIVDCALVAQDTDSLCLAGDLNTSFSQGDKDFKISDDTTNKLKELCKTCKVDLTTQDFSGNIDHIFLPKKLLSTTIVTSKIFIKKGILSDHQGIVLEIETK